MIARWLGCVSLALVAACSGTPVDPHEGPCNDYCELIMRNCKGADGQYSALDNCLATCATFDLGEPTVHTGDTIACRTFYAAIGESDKTACRKAGPGGDGQCGENCASFCASTQAICDARYPYTSVADCESACAGFAVDPPFSSNVQSGDSLSCRIYHMTAAATDPETHCPHTGVHSFTCGNT